MADTTVRMVDVAQAAGVSQATASRVLSGFRSVAPATREAVLAAAESMGYVINQSASALASKSAKSIGFVVAEPSAHIWSGTYFPRLLQGITEATNEHNNQLVMFMAQSEGSQPRLRQYLRQGHVDGLLMITSTEADPVLQELIRHQMPVVVGGRPVGVPDVDYVDIDNEQSAFEATVHLLRRGYKRPAVIAGPQSTAAGSDRLRGYLRAVADADVDANVIVAPDFSIGSGAEAARETLDRDGVDAIFAAGDALALGAREVLLARQSRVPEDVGLVGFDDSPAAAAVDLTSVSQPIEELGREMVRLLFDRMDRDNTVSAHTMLDTRLIARGSSAGPRP